MNTLFLAKLAILILTTVTLSGCILVPVDDGFERRDRHDNGGHRGEREGHGDRR